MTEIIRLDRATLQEKLERTREGYLRGYVVVTRTGVLDYYNADGSPRRELRHPDDVFQGDSLTSMKMIPVTLDHPSEGLVNADNFKRLGVGYAGEGVKIEGQFIKLPVVITDKAAIQAVDAGKREVSLGYTVQLLKEDGSYNGERYDYRQTNIKYNHLAIVSKARAGAQARLNLDGSEILITDQGSEENMTLVTVNVDGLNYQAAPEVERALVKTRADNSELTKRLDAAQAVTDAAKAEAQALKGKLDAAQAELKAVNDGMPAKIIEAAQARAAMLTVAKPLVPADTNLDGMTERQIMETVIKSRTDGVNLDGKSEDYVRARFDSVIELAAVEAKTDAEGAQRAVASGSGAQKQERVDANEARQRMIQRQINASQGKKD